MRNSFGFASIFLKESNDGFTANKMHIKSPTSFTLTGGFVKDFISVMDALSNELRSFTALFKSLLVSIDLLIYAWIFREESLLIAIETFSESYFIRSSLLN